MLTIESIINLSDLLDLRKILDTKFDLYIIARGINSKALK